MKRFLKSPIFNAVCIGVFTSYYAIIFLTLKGLSERLVPYEGDSAVWQLWNSFLSAGYQTVTAWILIGITLFVVVLLLLRRRPYDEYHASILTYCLVAASILTLAAIAIFFTVILIEPVWAAGKFTLFIMVHWITIVFSNLAYVLLCKWGQ